MLTSAYPKLRSWFNTVTSPSTTHASSMLIILGILAAVTDAQNVEEPVPVHQPKVSSSKSNSPGDSTAEAEAKSINSQDMIYYIAMGMLVSQGLIRLLTFISNRREAAALAASKKDDDLLNKGKGKKKGLSLNALDDVDMDEEAIKRRRQEHLAALGTNATLLDSDSDDDDYEESEGSESESDVSEDESEVEEIVEDDETDGHRVLGSSHQQ